MPLVVTLFAQFSNLVSKQRPLLSKVELRDKLDHSSPPPQSNKVTELAKHFLFMISENIQISTHLLS
jgi:hypothetical protein